LVLGGFFMIKNLEEFRAYQLAMDLGKSVWEIVNGWDYFSKDTIGKQLVRSTDSIAANLSEGLGRFHYKETRNFCYYARGSLFETRTWLTKAMNRDLITQIQFNEFIKDIDNLGIKINNYINSLK